MQTKTTLHLTGAARPLDRLQPAILIVVAVFILAAGLTTIGRIRSATSAAVPTPGLIIFATQQPVVIMPTAVPGAAQVADVSRGDVLPRAVTAWAAPDGQVLGAIEAGRQYRVVAASAGALWLQADVTGSGLVWMRTAELYGVDITQPTPAIAPQPQVIYVAQEGHQEAPQQAEAPVVPVSDEPQKPAYEPVSAPVEQPAAIPAVHPTLAPMEQTDVTKEWVRVQGCTEHPEWHC